MVKNKVNFKIGGEAGHGILNAGQVLAKVFSKGGLHVFSTAVYPSLIRGGHNHLDVRCDEEEIYSHVHDVSILVCLDQNTFNLHQHKMEKDGIIIWDNEKFEIKPEDLKVSTANLCPIPLEKIAKEQGGLIFRNVVAMGGVVQLLNLPLELFDMVIATNFKKKGQEIIDKNFEVARVGYKYVKENYKGKREYTIETKPYHKKIYVSGNEAIGIGAIKAGVKWYSAYPMTPASSILNFLAENEQKYNIVVKQTEDEIAAINMAIGASYTGVRTMTGTSGGGFALMTEAFGMAAQMELPLVVVLSSRPGPSTGMATQSGQSDLRFALHASQDEFPRIILAPGDMDECFKYTLLANDLADRYQLPVIILVDKFLSESYSTTDAWEHKEYKVDRGKLITNAELEKLETYYRYKVGDDPVSPRSIPGQPKGMHTASSYEHNEEGFECEDSDNKVMMTDKRYKKLELAIKDLPKPVTMGEENADAHVISWTSNKGVIREAMKLLNKEGIKVKFMHVPCVFPLPVDEITNFLKEAKTSFIVEGNYESTFGGLIRQYTGLTVDHKILKYDGFPFWPHEVADAIKKGVK